VRTEYENGQFNERSCRASIVWWWMGVLGYKGRPWWVEGFFITGGRLLR
jgi:hypothetical protein